VFFGSWHVTAGDTQITPIVEASVGRPADLLALVGAAEPEPVVLVSPAPTMVEAVIAAAAPHTRLAHLQRPLADAAVRLAARHRDRAVAPHAIRPLYVRRPDAVLARERAARRSTAALELTRATADANLADVGALQRRVFTNPWRTDVMEWELRHSDVARVYLARTPDGALAGYCACWLVFDELHLNSLAVDDVWRRHGVAKTLLRYVFRDCVAAGAVSATLEVRRSNAAALALYAGFGFHVEAVRRDYYQVPREDALILWNRALPRVAS
jgi:ribosomal-protein-alanine N-acetyltransferase